MAGEFGRTPPFELPQYYKLPGRDHWGKVQTSGSLAEGSAAAGLSAPRINIGGFPRSDPQTPENMAATIYQALGLPKTIAWHDVEGRPHYVYRGEPIPGLT